MPSPPLTAPPSPPAARQPRWARTPTTPSAVWTVTRDGWTLRPMEAGDAGRVRDFLLTQYDAFNAADNTPAGDAMFRDFVAVPALRSRLETGSVLHVAERRHRLLGVCEIHRDGYLTLLYVRGDHQGRGLGRRLLETALERLLSVAPDLERLRVRGTPYARGFYARLGFRETAGEAQEDRGIRYHPFELALRPDTDHRTHHDDGPHAGRAPAPTLVTDT